MTWRISEEEIVKKALEGAEGVDTNRDLEIWEKLLAMELRFVVGSVMEMAKDRGGDEGAVQKVEQVVGKVSKLELLKKVFGSRNICHKLFILT